MLRSHGHAAHLRCAAVSCAALLCRSLIDMRRADMRRAAVSFAHSNLATRLSSPCGESALLSRNGTRSPAHKLPHSHTAFRCVFRYEALDNPLAGDVHAVCPKFLAFKGPLRPGHPDQQDGEVAFPAGYYAKMFRGLGVHAVVGPDPHPFSLFPCLAVARLVLSLSRTTCLLTYPLPPPPRPLASHGEHGAMRSTIITRSSVILVEGQM